MGPAGRNEAPKVRRGAVDARALEHCSSYIPWDNARFTIPGCAVCVENNSPGLQALHAGAIQCYAGDLPPDFWHPQPLCGSYSRGQLLKTATERQCRRARALLLMYAGTTPASSFQNARYVLKTILRGLQALYTGAIQGYAGDLPPDLGARSPCVGPTAAD